MYRRRPDIYEMLDTLTLEMKEELLEYLKALRESAMEYTKFLLR